MNVIGYIMDDLLFAKKYRSVFQLDVNDSGVDGPFLRPAYQQTLASGRTVRLGIRGVVTPGTPDETIPIPNVTSFKAAIEDELLYVDVEVDALFPAGGGPPPTSLYDSLFAAFLLLKQALDKVETSGGLLPGGTLVACSRIGTNLPLRIDQLTRFALTSDGAGRWIDLSPGLVIDLAPQVYSAYDVSMAGVKDNAWSGPGRLWVQRRADELVLSPDIAGRAPASATGSAEWQQAIGGLADLDKQVLRKRLLRVLWPSQIGPAVPKSPSEEGWNTKTRVIFIGADDYTDLTAATDKLGKGEAPSVGAVFGYLTGRSSAQVRFGIRWNGTEVTVPVGSTLLDLLNGPVRALPAETEASLANGCGEIEITRWDQPAQRLPSFWGGEILRSFRVEVETNRPSGWHGASPLELPLLPGDQVQAIERG